MPFESSQGTTFSFDGETFKCVDISFEGSAPSRERVDMSTLDQANGSTTAMMVAPLIPKRDPQKFSITYRADGVRPNLGAVGTLTTSEGSGTYLCTKSTVSRKTNAYIEGTAEFEEIITGETP